jgi:uncharacterized membrane protein
LPATFSRFSDFSIEARRNCSMSPRALLTFFLVTCALSMAIAAAWASVGVWWVFPFAGLEISALGLAFIAHGRRVGDFERIHLDDERLLVEVCEKTRVSRYEFAPAWVRVETLKVGFRSEVVVRCRDRQVTVGRYLSEEGRIKLARDLAARLRERLL